jgi:hypothetical protein
MPEVITILEASVEPARWEELQSIYEKETQNIPLSIRQTFLMQSQSRPNMWWRVVTHWRSQADLNEMRATESVPVAVRIFRSVGAEPQLEIWDIDNHATEVNT